MIKTIESIKAIEHRYSTGEEPVQVQCSDLTTRICKYSRSSGSAYKLACELIGNIMAEAWNINAPDYCFVKVLRPHIPNDLSPHFFTLPCIGTSFLKGVIDITTSSYSTVATNDSTIRQLLKIALFDFWIANEDRNANNANLMYDVNNECIIPIDFGCILNTATFDFKLMQLTYTDTILYADIFRHLSQYLPSSQIPEVKNELQHYYAHAIEQSKNVMPSLIDSFPEQWRIPTHVIETKMEELFSPQWIEETWNNFEEQLNENYQYE